MNILVNDEIITTTQTHLQGLLNELHYPKQGFAVMLNNKHILRDDYMQTPIQADDCVTILIPQQGG